MCRLEHLPLCVPSLMLLSPLAETPIFKMLPFFIHKNVPPAHQTISLGSCGSWQHDQVSVLTWKWKESRSWAVWETLARQGITLSHFPQTTFFWNYASSESPHPGSPSPRWGKGSHHQADLRAVLGFSELEASLHYITPGRISEINEQHLVRFNISQRLSSHWRCNHKFPELWTTP